jgi:hypothetical protein
MKFRYKINLLIFLTLLAMAGVFSRGPIAEHTAYHNFCDRRSFLGVPNFSNVASNILFVIIGIRGLLLLRTAAVPGKIPVIYFFLFLGILLTGVGSAYYHLSPNNATLVFDRLPMTMVFMSLLSVVIAESIRADIGVILAGPLLFTGMVSVWWWRYTGQTGAGDLRLYILVQYYPMILIPLILLLFRGSVFKPGAYQLLRVLGWYVAAKVFEELDCSIWSVTGFFSGHSLKHISAALATGCLVRMFRVRYISLTSQALYRVH